MNSSFINKQIFRLSKKNYFIIFGSISALFILLILISSFCDFKISEAFSKWLLPNVDQKSIVYSDNILSNIGRVYSNNWFCNLIEILGFLPCLIAIDLSMFAFAYNARKIKVNWLSMCCIFASFIIATIASTYIFDYCFKYAIYCFSGANNFDEIYKNSKMLVYVLSAILSIITVMVGYKMFQLLTDETKTQLFRYAFITFISTVIVLIVSVVMLKSLLERERYRYIYAFSQISSIKGWTSYPSISGSEFSNLKYGGFRDWWNLGFNKAKFGDITQSFPSGHMIFSSIGFVSIMFIPFVIKTENKLLNKIYFWVLPALGCFIVGLGRIMAGAHYLSDITFALLIVVCCFYIIYFISNKYCKFIDEITKLKIYITVPTNKEIRTKN